MSKLILDCQPSWQQNDRTAGKMLNFNSAGLSDPIVGMKLVKGADGIMRIQSYVETKKTSATTLNYSPIVGNSKRDEFKVIKDGTPAEKNKDAFYAFKFRGLSDADKSTYSIAQWKLGNNYAQAAVLVTPNSRGVQELALQVQFNSLEVLPLKPEARAITKYLGVLYEKNKTYDLVSANDWQPNARGKIGIYINGKLCTTHIGQNMDKPLDPNSLNYPALRVGEYCWQLMNPIKTIPAVLKRITEYWDVKVGGQDMLLSDFVNA